jgi:hypothetical protein
MAIARKTPKAFPKIGEILFFGVAKGPLIGGKT